MTDLQLEEKITELQQKYFSTRNAHARVQIAALLEDYRSILTDRQIMERHEKEQKNNKDDDLGLDNLINVS